MYLSSSVSVCRSKCHTKSSEEFLSYILISIANDEPKSRPVVIFRPPPPNILHILVMERTQKYRTSNRTNLHWRTSWTWVYDQKNRTSNCRTFTKTCSGSFQHYPRMQDTCPTCARQQKNIVYNLYLWYPKSSHSRLDLPIRVSRLIKRDG